MTAQFEMNCLRDETLSVTSWLAMADPMDCVTLYTATSFPASSGVEHIAPRSQYESYPWLAWSISDEAILTLCQNESYIP